MTKNILQATVGIQGSRPFLYHVFTRDSIPLEKQERTGVAGHDPTEWRKSVTYTEQGQLWIPGTYIFGCLSNGSKYTKKGRGSIQVSLTSTLMVLDDKILFDRFIPGFNSHLPDTLPEDDGLPVYLDVRSVVNPTTKGRNIRYRVTMGVGWQTEFRIRWDKTIVNRNEMEAVCIDSGHFCGLGSGRKIGYGRFEITSFEVIE